MVAYSSAVENQLSRAKATRTQAEKDRQRPATEALTATKEACRAVIADAKRSLAKIKKQTEETDNHQQSPASQGGLGPLQSVAPRVADILER